ncbi:MAG: hypothetical protein U9R50_02965 [Campylobacterota bacterium]|nr:hypothetical protein [Campylobacterota bacterium]
MYKTLLAASVILALFSGCDDGISSPDASTLPAGFTVFDTTGGDIPYPNNILFAGSEDGTLNIAYDPNGADALIKESLNTLDGFSTSSPITVGITDDIDPLSLATGLSVYKVQAVASAQTSGIPAVTAIESKLTFGVDYYAMLNGSRVVVLPLKPLAADSNYMVVLNNTIVNAEGQALHADAVSSMLNSTDPLVDSTTGEATVYFSSDEAVNNATAMKLEGLRMLNQAMFLAMLKNGENCSASAIGVTCNDVVMTWSFKTQTIGKVAQAFSDENSAGLIMAQDTNLTSKDMLQSDAMAGIADVYAGILANVPYYLYEAETIHSTDPLNKYFEKQEGTDLPKAQSTQNLPILITVPNELSQQVKPASGWPVVIFQHGITADRRSVLAISEALASIGYAAVAIDLPLHGLTEDSLLKMESERTFNLDLMNNETGAPGPDGITDTSGTHYINLPSPLVSRDNLRQSTSDLIVLLNSLSSATNIGLDDAKVAFMGHSLGTIASFGFLTHRQMETVSLAMPGSGIAQLLNNSETFGPRIEAGLAANGIIKGTSDYDSFMLATQTLIDDADPINYAAQAVSKQNTIYAIEVIGDKVIPNSVASAPLSGTAPLLKGINAEDINTSSAPIVPFISNTVSRFLEGDHSSILSPAASLAATVEMQTQTASYMASSGTIIKVDNPDLIQQ